MVDNSSVLRDCDSENFSDISQLVISQFYLQVCRHCSVIRSGIQARLVI